MQEKSAALFHNLHTAFVKLKSVLDSARNSKISGEDVPGKMFLPAVDIFKELYDNLAVKTTEEFDAVVSSVDDYDGINCIFYTNLSLIFFIVQRVFTNLKDLELDWYKFLTTFDPEANEIEIAEGDIITDSINLVDARYV